jgi:hypothetical protein
VGVASWSPDPCASAAGPVADVAALRPWIDATMERLLSERGDGGAAGAGASHKGSALHRLESLREGSSSATV